MHEQCEECKNDSIHNTKEELVAFHGVLRGHLHGPSLIPPNKN